MNTIASLCAHPHSQAQGVEAISVVIDRSAAQLRLDYALTGDIGAIELALPGRAGRADNLWQKSCCEVFITAQPGGAYQEWNFAPSHHWAAYGFSGYRADMHNLEAARDPCIVTRREPGIYALSATIDLALLQQLHRDAAQAPLWMALSVVVKDRAGRTGWWALAHPPEPGSAPDFHHPSCFTLQIAPPEPA